MVDFANSPVHSGGASAWIEGGTITSVDPKGFTVSWESDNSEKELEGLPILSPCFHQGFGEGLFCLPESGAKALVLFPSDKSFPIVLGYYSDPEQQEPDQGAGATESSEIQEEAAVTFGAGRKTMHPGDFSYYGREGNFIFFRRDGSVGVGSSPGCQTMYFPLQNLLWSVAKKARLDTSGGQLFWDVSPSDNGDKDVTQLKAYLKERAGATKASILVRMGRVLNATQVPGDDPGKGVFEMVVSPEGVDAEGRCSKQKIVLRFDHNGNLFFFTRGTVTTEIKETWSTECKKRALKVTEDSEVHVGGNYTLEVDGDLTIKARNVKIEATGNASFLGSMLRFGSAGASQAFIKGIELVAALASHVHPSPGAPPVQAPTYFTLMSKKIMGE